MILKGGRCYWGITSCLRYYFGVKPFEQYFGDEDAYKRQQWFNVCTRNPKKKSFPNRPPDLEKIHLYNCVTA